MDPIEFHDHIIKPTLDQLRLDQPGASFLLLGTALMESNLTHVRQLSGGPALGVFQMEPATHDDIWLNWLNRRTSAMNELGNSILGLAGDWPPGAMQMVANLQYATAMARVLYRRRPERLPDPFNIPEQANYWKRHYNTYQPEQTHKYISGQLARYAALFPMELLEREGS